MKLYMFEHCSLCFRVRMIAALKNVNLREKNVLNDDSETIINLVGRRVIPILAKDDGTPMLDSMDMVAYIDAIGEPLLTRPERPAIAEIEEKNLKISSPLTMPRYPLLGLPEFATVAASDHYSNEERENLQELCRTSREYPKPYFDSHAGLVCT